MPVGTSSSGPAKAGTSSGITGASRVRVNVPAPSSSAVTVSGSPPSTMRLLSVPNRATNSADTTPATIPACMPAGTPPTTSQIPGSEASPSSRSRGWKRWRVSSGSTSAVIGVAKAMQVAATEAFDNLIAP